MMGSEVGGGSVEGNARLTGTAGAVIFVLLAIEGVTIPFVQRLLSAHVFLGMLLVPIVALKIASTVYRFARYYRGGNDYSAKGPPPLVLRLAGPLVIASTIAVFATGIAAIAVGRSSRWILQAHKASFIVWFGVMVVHVLGHILETPALAVADWRMRQGSKLDGTAIRRALVVGTLAAGLVLAVLSLGWIDTWRHASRHG
ncbi:MAG: hypothetical protein JWL83_2156 [Actinomycetia bacterium]|nr:hypothetical protein [Actinomycetes bacterium]